MNAEHDTAISVNLRGKSVDHASRCVAKSDKIMVEPVGKSPKELSAGGRSPTDSPPFAAVGYASITPSPPLRSILSSLAPPACTSTSDEASSEKSREETLRLIVNQDVINREPSLIRPAFAAEEGSGLFSSLRLPEPVSNLQILPIPRTHGAGERLTGNTTGMTDAEWKQHLDQQARASLSRNGPEKKVGEETQSKFNPPAVIPVFRNGVSTSLRAAPGPLRLRRIPVSAAFQQMHLAQESRRIQRLSTLSTHPLPDNTANRRLLNSAVDGPSATEQTGHSMKQKALRLLSDLRNSYKDDIQV